MRCSRPGRRACHAVAVDPAPGAATRDGFKAIGLACLKQIIGNEPALLAGDPEGVHQMRVGLRRLRAAISLFADILQDPQTAALKDELKWLTSELGPARELEVLVTRVVAPVRRRHSRLEESRALARPRAATRRGSRAPRMQYLPRFRALTLDIAAWLEAGEWTRPQNDLVRDRGDVAIETSAAGQLTRRFRKIRKQGKLARSMRGAATSSASRRRRCATRRSSSPTSSPARRRRGGARSSFRRSDAFRIAWAISTTSRCTRTGSRPSPIAAGKADAGGSPKRAFAAGLLTGREDARLDTVLASASDVRVLAKIKPFWR